jgi:adenylate kinase family enzyme
MREGRLTPSDFLVRLIQREIERLGNAKPVLLDGFPRNRENIVKWEEMLGSEYGFKHVLYFQCSGIEMEKRLVERGRVSGRADDNLVTIKKRLGVFRNETKPLIREFRDSGVLIRVNAKNSIEEVWEELKRKMIKAGYEPIV